MENETKKPSTKKLTSKQVHTKQFSHLGRSTMRSLIAFNGADQQKKVDQQFLADEIHEMAVRLTNGYNNDILTVLATSLLQLQMFNEKVAQNLVGPAGSKLDGFETLCNLQLKVMAETRKTVMAVNEVTNPKRTTFIKEVAQHNHLHSNSEKKDEIENELQKAIPHNEQTEEAIIYPAMERVR